MVSKKHIAIVTPCLVDGDAVSNDVMGMYEFLTRSGYDCRVFAENYSLSKAKVFKIEGLSKYLKKSSDIIIYHYSIGWHYTQTILQLNCTKIVKYHNVTPAEFYEGINEDYANVCRAGREQLLEIALANCNLYLADSVYNAMELIEAGANPELCCVIPPFHHIDRLFSLEADLNVIERYQDGKTNILMVGRIAPNKGHSSLIKAFYIYHTYYNCRSRLIFVGGKDERLKNYNDKLILEAESLGILPYIIFTDKVSDHLLKAYYLIANFFVIASEHEGFCVPLVESMAMKIPVIAYSSTAIPYTVGKAGLVWPEKDPYLLAGSLDYLSHRNDLCMKLGEMGYKQYKNHFTNSQIAFNLREALKKFL